MAYPDGGKSCHDSNECVNDCVIYEHIQEQPMPIVGVCRENNDPFERCFATIEHPEIFLGCAD
jgi:hypothetical protein